MTVATLPQRFTSLRRVIYKCVANWFKRMIQITSSKEPFVRELDITWLFSCCALDGTVDLRSL